MFRSPYTKVGKFSTKARKVTHTKTLSFHVPNKTLKLLVKKAKKEKKKISEVSRELLWKALDGETFI